MESGATRTCRCRCCDDYPPSSNTVEYYACTQVGVPCFYPPAATVLTSRAGGFCRLPCSDPEWPNKVSGFGTVSGSNWTVLGGLDPRSKRVQKWNRALLAWGGWRLTRCFTRCRSGGSPCLWTEGLAAIVTVARTCVDAVHLPARVAAVPAGVRVAQTAGSGVRENWCGTRVRLRRITCDC